eukprot:3927686-Rhodomonas_salina.7
MKVAVWKTPEPAIVRVVTLSEKFDVNRGSCSLVCSIPGTPAQLSCTKKVESIKLVLRVDKTVNHLALARIHSAIGPEIEI